MLVQLIQTLNKTTPSITKEKRIKRNERKRQSRAETITKRQVQWNFETRAKEYATY